jgi:hypothetical protein
MVYPVLCMGDCSSPNTASRGDSPPTVGWPVQSLHHPGGSVRHSPPWLGFIRESAHSHPGAAGTGMRAGVIWVIYVRGHHGELHPDPAASERSAASALFVYSEGPGLGSEVRLAPVLEPVPDRDPPVPVF